ncbi:16S rRNA (cytosine(967)-C(5))-methyltransferase RsmB [bacterium]|nr:16S rRNA (cytosine(967)-C(5))-methyltransferase RsmB [bacterium]
MKRFYFGRGPRAVATFVCHIVNGANQRAKGLLEGEFEKSDFDRRDRDLVTELVYGTLRRRGTLDAVIARFSRLPLKKVQPRVIEILRIGAYQLLFFDKVPASAAVNEAVKAAKRVCSRGGIRFVNACLRSIARSIQGKGEDPGADPRRAVPLGEDLWCVFDQPVLPDPRADTAAYLAAAWSHPEWLLRRWLDRHGDSVTRALCECDNIAASPLLRVNRLRASRDALLADIVGQGHWAQPLGEEHIRLRHGGSPIGLDAFANGLCTVQGIVASRAAPLLAPQPGEMLLDLCAAPGTKACQLAELAQNQATVVAVDISRSRLGRVQENVQRLGARTVWAVAGDGCSCERLLRTHFDGVLVDVPCSNTGVLSRRVESRWRMTPARLAEMAALQYRLAASAIQAVRPGGRLVYSTCSLEPEENEHVVEKLCKTHADVRVAEMRTYLPSETHDDGGFVALLHRAESNE